MSMIPIIIPMGEMPSGPLTKGQARYFTMVACCSLMGFAYGNLKTYEEIEERRGKKISPPSMIDHASNVINYTVIGGAIGLTFPLSVPSIMFYYYYYANRKNRIR